MGRPALADFGAAQFVEREKPPECHLLVRRDDNEALVCSDDGIDRPRFGLDLDVAADRHQLEWARSIYPTVPLGS